MALTLQNQPKDAFPSYTNKNKKDCMVVTLKNGRDIEIRKEEEEKKIEKDQGKETRKENKLSSLDLAKETEKEEVQIEQ